MNAIERAAARKAAVASQKLRAKLQWLWLVPALLGVVVLVLALPLVNNLLEALQPRPRTDLQHQILGSISLSDSEKERLALAKQTETICNWINERLGFVPTEIYRFGSTVVDAADVPHDHNALLHHLKAYAVCAPDPRPGTHLAPALRRAVGQVPVGKTVFIEVATDLWEDLEDVRALLKDFKAKGRKIVLLVHGTPVGDGKGARRIVDYRGLAKWSISPLGPDGEVADHANLDHLIQVWLPDRLRAHGVRF